MYDQYALISDEGRRQATERRQANFRSMCYALFMTRRKTNRRSNDTVSYYSDQYGHYAFAAALLMMLLCVLDAYFTLILIRYGSSELNPILAWALHGHVMVFFSLKYTLTALCVIITVMHKHFQLFGMFRVRGHHILFASLLAYGCLIQYQLFMLIPILY